TMPSWPGEWWGTAAAVPTGGNNARNRHVAGRRRAPVLRIVGLEAKFFRQQFERGCHQLFGGIPAALENFRIGGSIKEPGSDAQRANPIARRPRGTDLRSCD